MAVIHFNSAHTSVSAATAAGALTVGSSTGFAVGARVWLNGAQQTRLDYNTKTAGWTNGETVTGATSGATATISVLGGAPGAAAGTLILTAVTGTFQAGEALNGSTSGSHVALATAPQYVVTAGGNQFCQITSIPDGTHVNVRKLPDPGNVLEDKAGGGGGGGQSGSAVPQDSGTTGNNIAFPNYGNSDVSGFNAFGGFLDQEPQDIYVTNADNSLRTQA